MTGKVETSLSNGSTLLPLQLVLAADSVEKLLRALSQRVLQGSLKTNGMTIVDPGPF